MEAPNNDASIGGAENNGRGDGGGENRRRRNETGSNQQGNNRVFCTKHRLAAYKQNYSTYLNLWQSAPFDQTRWSKRVFSDLLITFRFLWEDSSANGNSFKLSPNHFQESLTKIVTSISPSEATKVFNDSLCEYFETIIKPALETCGQDEQVKTFAKELGTLMSIIYNLEKVLSKSIPRRIDFAWRFSSHIEQVMSIIKSSFTFELNNGHVCRLIRALQENELNNDYSYGPQFVPWLKLVLEFFDFDTKNFGAVFTSLSGEGYGRKVLEKLRRVAKKAMEVLRIYAYVEFAVDQFHAECKRHYILVQHQVKVKHLRSVEISNALFGFYKRDLLEKLWSNMSQNNIECYKMTYILKSLEYHLTMSPKEILMNCSIMWYTKLSEWPKKYGGAMLDKLVEIRSCLVYLDCQLVKWGSNREIMRHTWRKSVAAFNLEAYFAEHIKQESDTKDLQPFFTALSLGAGEPFGFFTHYDLRKIAKQFLLTFSMAKNNADLTAMVDSIVPPQGAPKFAEQMAELPEKFKAFFTDLLQSTKDSGSFKPAHGIEFKARALIKGAWPWQPEEALKCSLPKEMADTFKSFETHYKAQFSSYENRKLVLLPQFGKGEVAATFGREPNERTYTIVGRTVQLMIMSLFNNNTKLTFEEMRTKMDLADVNILKQALLPMIEYKILRVAPKNNKLGPSHMLWVNEKFTAEGNTIDISRC